MSNLIFTPPKSLLPFLKSDKFASFVVGPLGSAKTTAAIMKIAYMAKRMAAGKDGIRRSRCVVVRNTRQMLFDTTIPDFMKWFPDGQAGSFLKTESKYILRFDDVECEVLFRGLDDANDVRRLLSLQLSFGIMDEFREIHPDVYEALVGRLGRYPDKTMVSPRAEWGVDVKGNPIGGCVDDQGKPMKQLWGATNPPDVDTFWEKLLTAPPDNVHVTIQPSGLSQEADWIHLLDSNYYENLAELHAGDERWVDVYIHAKFGGSLAGMPVFRAFDSATHVAREALRPSSLFNTLIIGVDAGLSPAAVLGQVDYSGRVLVYDALTSEGMGALRFVREKIKPLIASKYPGYKTIVIIDPAAFQRAQTDERTVADIYKAEGFTVRPARTNGIAARLSAVDSYLTRTVDGKSAFLLCPEGAKSLIQAMRGKYRYKMKKNGEVEDTPEKSHPWSDECVIAGTMIATPTGEVPIESLRVGDVILSHDGPDTVTAVGSRVKPTITLTLSNGVSITCTPDHPFAVNNHTCFLQAEALDNNSMLIGLSTTAPLRVIRSSSGESARVYNLTTGRTHMYYANGVLVHNCDALQYLMLHADNGASLGGTLTTRGKQEIKKVSAGGWT